MNKKVKKAGAAMAVLLLAALLFPVSGFAQDMGESVDAANQPIDTQRKASLRLQYRAADAEFSIYRVAEVTPGGNFVLTEAFADSDADLDTVLTDETLKTAQALADYVGENDPEAYRTGTAQDGVLEYPDIDCGLYLVIGEPSRVGLIEYQPVPALVPVPYTGEDETWVYDTQIEVKYEQKEYTEDPPGPSPDPEPGNPSVATGDTTTVTLLVFASLISGVILIWKYRKRA